MIRKIALLVCAVVVGFQYWILSESYTGGVLDLASSIIVILVVGAYVGVEMFKIFILTPMLQMLDRELGKVAKALEDAEE